MGNEAVTQAEADEEILSFDIPDDALASRERRTASIHLGILH